MTRTQYVLAALTLAGAFASHAEARFGNQTPVTPGNTQPLFGNQTSP